MSFESRTYESEQLSIFVTDFSYSVLYFTVSILQLSLRFRPDPAAPRQSALRADDPLRVRRLPGATRLSRGHEQHAPCSSLRAMLRPETYQLHPPLHLSFARSR